MIHSVRNLDSLRLEASDGVLERIRDVYFDDVYWTVRYLVCDTGGWLTRKQVLISPIAVTSFDAYRRALRVDLTREQLENSPGIDSDQPVSRQQERQLFDYYGWPYYWPGPMAWGGVTYPVPMPAPLPGAGGSPGAPGSPGMPAGGERDETPAGDQHLRSANEVTGYAVKANDGRIGRIDDLLFDDRTWAMRYAVVDTREWWPGGQVLIDTAWIESVDWSRRSAEVSVSRADVEHSPEFDPRIALSPDYERRLREHYLRLRRAMHE